MAQKLKCVYLTARTLEETKCCQRFGEKEIEHIAQHQQFSGAGSTTVSNISPARVLVESSSAIKQKRLFLCAWSIKDVLKMMQNNP